MKFFSDRLPNININSLITSSRWAFRLTWSRHKPLLSGIIVVSFIQSLLPAGLALVSRGLVNTVSNIVTGENDNIDAMLLWLAFGLILTLSFSVSNSINKFFSQRLQDELNLSITSDILSHAAGLDTAQFEDPRFQDILERAQKNTAQNFSQFIDNMLKTITNIIQGVTLLVILVVIEPVIVFLLLPISLPYILYQWRLSKTHYLLKRSRSTKRRWTNYFVTRLTQQESVPEVKLLDLAPLFKRKFRSLMSEFRDQDRKLYIRSCIINVIFAFLSITAVYAAFTRVCFQVTKGALTIGDVAIYGVAVTRLRGTVENTIMAVVTALEQMMFITNLIEFFQIKPQITSKANLTLQPGCVGIELKDVSFTYQGSGKPVLKYFSLKIEPGETIALVGENGAGKTTLVKLIARLYDPNQGRILFDGHDLRNLSLDYLYSQISFVFQNFGRYEATVSDNIAYGNWHQMLHDKKQIEQLACLTGAHDMIKAMPQGYDTMLGRSFGEYTLSGGQWQQIALSRAFARDAKLIILDEPTSNLDARSEYRLFCHFQKMAKGRTTILISHRFSTVSMADRILVMDNGQIVEEGTHKKLLAQGGLYSSLYRLHHRQMAAHPA